MLAAAAAQSKYCKMLRYNPLEHCTECWCHPDHHHPLTTWTTSYKPSNQMALLMQSVLNAHAQSSKF